MVIVAGYILMGTLAAFGLFSLLWTVFGWLLPDGRGCAVVCFGEPDEGILSRYRWLRGMGWLRCPLLYVAEGPGRSWSGTEICTGEDLLSRLEWERNRFNGTGDGDPAGRSERCGVSEL